MIVIDYSGVNLYLAVLCTERALHFPILHTKVLQLCTCKWQLNRGGYLERDIDVAKSEGFEEPRLSPLRRVGANGGSLGKGGRGINLKVLF